MEQIREREEETMAPAKGAFDNELRSDSVLSIVVVGGGFFVFAFILFFFYGKTRHFSKAAHSGV